MNNKAGTTGFLEILKRYNRKSLPSDALFHIYHRSRLNLPGNSVRFQYSSSWSQITIHSLFCTQPSVMEACILSSPNPLQWIPRSYLAPILCNGSLHLICFLLTLSSIPSRLSPFLAFLTTLSRLWFFLILFSCTHNSLSSLWPTVWKQAHP